MRCRWLVLLFLFMLARSISPANPPGTTARGAGIVREMNLARQHPGIYATFLEELRANFRGNVCVLPGGMRLHTPEGVGALDDAIRFLRRTRPIAPLTLSAGLSRAAAEHVAAQACGALGHTGPDHSSPAERISRHGTWSGRWGEDISYGESSARGVVLALIIDDGQRGRPHRRNIFNPAFNYAGAALGPHARYRVVCSIDFAGGYAEGPGNAPSLFAGN